MLFQRIAATAIVSAGASACDPTIVIGARVCSESAAADAAPDPDVSVAALTTGFEDGFCDYSLPRGFCIKTGSGSYSQVTSPVHSGKYAAAFSVVGAADAGGAQSRCVEQGVFPDAAYYGAWYNVPAPAQATGPWNLLHFQGAAPGQTMHGLWDVSLVNASSGGDLHAVLYDFLNGAVSDSSATPSIPIGQWFHLEVYFKRAKDATGEIAMWQDGVMMEHLTGLITDDTDWGQWYVGNLATELVPPASTVYVDDVTIGLTQ